MKGINGRLLSPGMNGGVRYRLNFSGRILTHDEQAMLGATDLIFSHQRSGTFAELLIHPLIGSLWARASTDDALIAEQIFDEGEGFRGTLTR